MKTKRGVGLLMLAYPRPLAVQRRKHDNIIGGYAVLLPRVDKAFSQPSGTEWHGADVDSTIL